MNKIEKRLVSAAADKLLVLDIQEQNLRVEIEKVKLERVRIQAAYDKQLRASR